MGRKRPAGDTRKIKLYAELAADICTFLATPSVQVISHPASINA
jgi:hypothetical protein